MPSLPLPLPRLLAGSSLLALLGAVTSLLWAGSPLLAGMWLALSLGPLARTSRRRSAVVLIALFVFAFALIGVLVAPPIDGATLVGLEVAVSGVALASGALGLLWVLTRESVVLFAAAPARLEACPDGLDVERAMWRAVRAPTRARPEALRLAVRGLASATPEIVPSDEHDRRAFWINVYNVIALHLSGVRSSATSYDLYERQRAPYWVAGQQASLAEIEHGILHGRLATGDPRKPWAVPFDPRTPSALRRPAARQVQLRHYGGARLDEQLALAERASV